MPFLYINVRGAAWRKHSYSAGNVFDRSPYAYYLQKVLGWKEKDNKARLRFGRALEEAIQFHHEHGHSGVEEFTRRWKEHEASELIFTKVEKDWANLNRIGQEMIRLYLIHQPSLPIPIGANVAFQREYSKEVFPGDPVYGEIEDAGKLDIIAFVDPHHPCLPRVDWKPEYGPTRPVIVDIKTAAVDFSDVPGIAAFDKQLRRYAWLSGIPDVALLWFKKSGTSLSKGCSVSLLETAGEFEAGDEAVIAQVDDHGVWLVRTDFELDCMAVAQGFKADRVDTTKAAKARKQEWIAANAVCVSPSAVTRQRLQFNCGRVTPESAEDAGLIAARQIKSIVDAWNSKRWPNTFGIRFPTDDTRDPYFRAFALNDAKYRDENFDRFRYEEEDLYVEEESGDPE